jgi:hypothetical protein
VETDLVRYSRAGDVFHYRWAARRCLRMIHPKSQLRLIVIEGSKERKMAGEYVIDVAEYFELDDDNHDKVISYFQLKHTTARKEQPFNLSDLKGTMQGFAERFTEHSHNRASNSPKVTFTIVTNRPFSQSFKENILKIGRGDKVNAQFKGTLEKYTSLTGKALVEFCACLGLADGEGDYDVQRGELQAEIAQLLAGTVDSPQIDSIAVLVQEKALPSSDGQIVREEILKRFGVTTERDLYPAPAKMEDIDNTVTRNQHLELLERILSASSNPVIIHAAGGVGKSVFSRQIIQSLPHGSFGVVYDCFGGGRYRNRSEPRHRYRDALVQIINELASNGLCEPLIAQSTALEDEILRKFITRLDTASKALRRTSSSAALVILVDAADNAEMAAKEFNQPCFVHELLRERLPEGCRLVMLCRTERIQLLQPTCSVLQVELKSFTEAETLIFFRTRFPFASETEGIEFHRLTNGNPRVQANALASGSGTLVEILSYLGPSVVTVEEQIQAQLEAAISSVKETLSEDYQSRVNAICVGLATLPPLIPMEVLAAAADVDTAMVRSFVADLGRPLWISDTSVQFRDEPTETWFRERFSASQEQIVAYVDRLKPSAGTSAYVSEAIPSLLLQAGQYDELIKLALSDKYLPTDNPIDERNVRVYRLQFAFKAAIRLERYDDAIRIALLAGEEAAGDSRQIELLKENVDLIAPLQDAQKVQEFAFRRTFQGEWDGSENVYSASLLSSVSDFKGEAVGYLRAAHNWLDIYFEERKKSKDDFRHKQLKDQDIVELTIAHCNVFGISKAIRFLLSWNKPSTVYRIAQKFARRLIDAGRFNEVNEILLNDTRNQYLVIAVVHELMDVGQIPSKSSLEHCLDLLTLGRTRIPKPDYSYQDTTVSAIVSFLEACTTNKLCKRQILRVLRYYIPIRASRIVGSNHQASERDIYLRATALRSVLNDNFGFTIDELLPEEYVQKDKTYKHESDIREFREVVGGLLPWYIVRARVLNKSVVNISEEINNADSKSKSALLHRWGTVDLVPYEISRIYLEILSFFHDEDVSLIKKMYDRFHESKNIRIQDLLRAVRTAYRASHLAEIRSRIEGAAHEMIAIDTGEAPETRAGWYIDLARSLLPVSCEDAAVYFEYAIKALSKFGDEIVQRWEAVVSLAKRTAEGGHVSSQMAYRFIRCAELIGDNVAREKYFNRNEAVRVCAKLSPASALAALSRWRDRDVGWFDEQLPALADELVKSNYLLPSVAWSLSAFFESGLDDFAQVCISKEPNLSTSRNMLTTAIHELRLNEATKRSWDKLREAASLHSIVDFELENIHAYYTDHATENEKLNHTPLQQEFRKEAETVSFQEVFDDLILTSSSDLGKAIERFKGAQLQFRNWEEFWHETFIRIDESNVVKFLYALVNAEDISIYIMRTCLELIPSAWRGKISVKQNWLKVLEIATRRFADHLTSHGSLGYFLGHLEADGADFMALQKTVLTGLSGNSDIVSAEIFFGFVENATPFITPEEALDLLDFALGRFESHIDDDYADGAWSSCLIPPDEISVAFAGFIWSALGSPRSKMRWQAAHCVRRLASVNSQSEINELIMWMEKDTVDAFGCHKFPFYNLHARLYLLIALARVAIDNPSLLREHYEVFRCHALAKMNHILIQKFAAEIALGIQKAYDTTYSQDIIEQLRQVGVSELPKLEIGRRSEKIDSYWHARGEVDTSLEFNFGYDFSRYWLDPLGDVFGIPVKQVEDIITEIIAIEWNIKADGSYANDPRVKIWRSRRSERETWHDHGSYPRTDDYNFYLSYHAMFVTAGKLLQKMPVVYKPDWGEDEWADWLQQHVLTRSDGRWLADRRDPAPLLRPVWVGLEHNREWRSEISEADCLNALLYDSDGETWINVSGVWEESDNVREENYYISSAIVANEASVSLLRALSTCPDPDDFKIPEYEEDEMEFNAFPFVLSGWVKRANLLSRLDKFDPHAASIDYPPYEIGQSIIDQLGLSVGKDKREWYFKSKEKASMLCRIWSTSSRGPEDDPLRNGSYLSASMDFLQALCHILKKDIIIKVKLNRRFRQNSYTKDEGGNVYKPFCKIYIFSEDGILRDTETYYQFRKSTC